MLQKENRSEGVLKRGAVGEKSRGKPWAQGSGLRAQGAGLSGRTAGNAYPLAASLEPMCHIYPHFVLV